MAKKPATPLIYEKNIPAELKKQKTWCCWFYKKGKDKDGSTKWNKPPCNIYGQIENHLEMNFTFDQVMEAYKNEKNIDGIGISIRNDDNFCGIDIDHCINGSGTLNLLAKKTIKQCKSYTEVSPSGEGLRIFGFGDPGVIKTDQIEIYDKGRYLTVTGNKINKLPVRDITKPGKKIIKKFRKKPQQRTISKIGKGNELLAPIIAKLAYIPPELHYTDWLNMCFAFHNHFNGNDTGLNLFLRWSKGDFWKKPYKDFDYKECADKYESADDKKDGRTIKTIDYYYKQFRPDLRVVLKDNQEQEVKIAFPVDPYKGHPEFVQMMFEQFREKSAQPIDPFLYMSTEVVTQFLVGNNILTAQKSRTTATPMMGAGLSTAGKDLNTTAIIGQLKKELSVLGKKKNTIGYLTYLKHLGRKTGNHTSSTSFLKMIGEGNLRLWIETEASQILRTLASEHHNHHGGQALAISLNESYDGHEIAGRNLAKEKLPGLELPQIPICWLTQIDNFSNIITQDLLDVGFLGRMDYFFDLEDRIEKSSFDLSFQETPFDQKFLHSIFKLLKKIFELKNPHPATLNLDARQILIDWENAYIINKDRPANYTKFLKRITMSAEKRLSLYAMLNSKIKNKGDYFITKDMVEAHLPIMDYQLKIRKHVYENEITGKDLYKDIRFIYHDLLPKQRKKVQEKGVIRWSCFYNTFRNRYKSKYPELQSASAIQREISALANQGLLTLEEVENWQGKWLRCLI